MKKMLGVFGLLVLSASVSFGQIDRRGAVSMFANTGVGTNIVIVKEGSGVQVIESFNYVVGAVSATIKWYPASSSGNAGTFTAAASTNLQLVSDSAGKIGGRIGGVYLPAANDYVIVADTSTNANGYQLRKVAALGPVTTNGSLANVNVQLIVAEGAGTATMASNDVVFFVKSGDISTRAVSSSGNNELIAAAGNFAMPLGLTMTETGVAATAVSGVAGLYQ